MLEGCEFLRVSVSLSGLTFLREAAGYHAISSSRLFARSAQPRVGQAQAPTAGASHGDWPRANEGRSAGGGVRRPSATRRLDGEHRLDRGSAREAS
jgi:hypothetical protein